MSDRTRALVPVALVVLLVAGLALWARTSLRDDEPVDCGGVGFEDPASGATPEDAVTSYAEQNREAPWARRSPRFDTDAEFVRIDGNRSEIDALLLDQVSPTEWRVIGGCVTEPPPEP